MEFLLLTGGIASLVSLSAAVISKYITTGISGTKEKKPVDIRITQFSHDKQRVFLSIPRSNFSEKDIEAVIKSLEHLRATAGRLQFKKTEFEYLNTQLSEISKYSFLTSKLEWTNIFMSIILSFIASSEASSRKFKILLKSANKTVEEISEKEDADHNSAAAP